MKTLLILHGVEGKAGDHWEKWLHDEAEKLGFLVIMPNLPHSEHPERIQWLNTIKENLKNVELTNLVIAAHSLGVTAALDFIEQAELKIKALISISGFSYDYGSPLNNYFLKQKSVDMQKIKQHIEHCFIFYGDNDPYVPQETLQSLGKELGVTPVVVHNGGHINTDAGFTTFPQLLDILKTL